MNGDLFFTTEALWTFSGALSTARVATSGGTQRALTATERSWPLRLLVGRWHGLNPVAAGAKVRTVDRSRRLTKLAAPREVRVGAGGKVEAARSSLPVLHLRDSDLDPALAEPLTSSSS